MRSPASLLDDSKVRPTFLVTVLPSPRKSPRPLKKFFRKPVMPRPGTSQRRRHNCRTPFKASPDRGGEYAAAPRLGDAKIADDIFQQRSLIDAQSGASRCRDRTRRRTGATRLNGGYAEVTPRWQMAKEEQTLLQVRARPLSIASRPRTVARSVNGIVARTGSWFPR